jgi:hypothetical protein
MYCDGEFHIGERKFAFNVNGYWTTIHALRGSYPEVKAVVFKREPTNNDWLDKEHAAIVKAIRQLETALGKVAIKV